MPIDPTTGLEVAAPPPPVAAPPQMFTVKVDGVERQVTQDELLRGYQLETAARARMDEAAKLKQAVQADIHLADSLRRLGQSQDPAALADVFRGMGVAEEKITELTAAAAEMMRQGAAAPTPARSAGLGAVADTLPPIGLQDLDPDLQALLSRVAKSSDQYERGSLAQTREQMFSQAQNCVDNDPILGKIQNVQVKQFIASHVKDQVQLRVGMRHEPWPGVLDDILQQTRTVFQAAGTSGDGSPDQALFGAIGPAATAGGAYRAKEPPKPVSITDPSYRKNFGERLAYALAKAAGRR